MERIGPSWRIPRLVFVGVAVLFVLIFGRSICSLIIDYQWWKEMGQVSTWVRMNEYRYLPGIAGWLVVWAILWLAHARGLKYAGLSLSTFPLYAKVSAAGLGLLALILAAASIDGWLVARYIGGQGVTSTWSDPTFGRPLSFYFFELPFYKDLVGFLEMCAFVAALVYYLAARVWQVRKRFPGLWQSGNIEWDDLRALGKLESGLLSVAVAIFLVGLAANFWLGRYDLLYSDHGNLMVGIDYIEQHIGLPMQTAKAAAALLAAALVLAGQRRWAVACAAVLVVSIGAPPIVSSLYVRPNELALEKPYLIRHIEATRHGFGLDHRVSEVQFNARREAPVDFAANK